MSAFDETVGDAPADVAEMDILPVIPTGPVIVSDDPVTLVGGGRVRGKDLVACLRLAPIAVGADSGAEALLAKKKMPDAVIGDMDSISDDAVMAVDVDALHEIPEQVTTDFEKCLSRIDAPLTLAVGVSARRLDHALSAFETLLRHPHRRCIIVDVEDVVMLCPPSISMQRLRDDRVSIYPLVASTARSTGLKWPLDGLELAPGVQIATSNKAEANYTLETDAPGLLLILPRQALKPLMAALQAAPTWPAPEAVEASQTPDAAQDDA